MAVLVGRGGTGALLRLRQARLGSESLSQQNNEVLGWGVAQWSNMCPKCMNLWL
jgi:hypothetical protein